MADNSGKYAIALRRPNTRYGEALHPKLLSTEDYDTYISTKGNNSVAWQKAHTLLCPLSGIPIKKHGTKFLRKKEKYIDGKYLNDINTDFKTSVQNGDNVILYIKPELGNYTSQDEPLKKSGSKSIFGFIAKNKRHYAVIPVKSVNDISNAVNEVREILAENPQAINNQLYTCFMGSIARITDLNIPRDSNDKIQEIIKRLGGSKKETYQESNLMTTQTNEAEPAGQNYTRGIGYT